jgi:hypothetical protein
VSEQQDPGREPEPEETPLTPPAEEPGQQPPGEHPGEGERHDNDDEDGSDRAEAPA